MIRCVVSANETAYSNYTDTYTMYNVYNNNTASVVETEQRGDKSERKGINRGNRKRDFKESLEFQYLL
jgi:hypothetical protein